MLLTAINVVFFAFRNTRPFTFEEVVDSKEISKIRDFSIWVKDIPASDSEKKRIKVLIDEQPIPIVFMDSMKLVAAIHSHFFQGYYGKPSYNDGISVAQKLYLNQVQLTKLYCDDLTDGFILIAQELGLKCRQVNTVSLLNNKWESEHVMLEVWCAELSKWVVSDPTTQTYFFQPPNSPLISASELYDLYAVDNHQRQTTSDSLEIFLRRYIRPKSCLAFVKKSWNDPRGPFVKISNYLTLETYFSYYGSNLKLNNSLGVLRLFFLLSWLFFTVLFVFKRN